MTDTTDIKALTRYDLTQDVETGQCDITPVPVSHDGRYVRYEEIKHILEAERQRADDRAKENYRNKCDFDNCMETIANLEAEIAALKGEQVPVVWKVTTPSGSIVFHTEEQDMDGHSYYGNTVTPLFTAPQKPVVLPAGFYADNDDALLIGRDDAIAAIEAAGGIVKGGE